MKKEDLNLILKAQKNEITEYHIYNNLSKKTKSKHNKKVLQHMAKDELRHYNFWKKISKRQTKPNKFKISFFTFIAYLFGLSFGLKLMEKGEQLAYKAYKNLKNKYKGVARIIKDEHDHEKKILSLLKEERIEYAGSMVLGLNDALVELTGALAGLTLALQNNTIIAVTGLIIGIAASLSMASSEYLSSKEDKHKNPLKSAIYTGIAYLITVILLISPYLLLNNIYSSLAAMIIIGILIVALYTFYMSVAKSLKFWPRFLRMIGISLTVAIISFLVGYLVRNLFGIEI
jgi:vacuolar iron transporter family protein